MAGMEEKIRQINALYHKSKTPAGLTEEEKALQQAPRMEFIRSVRANVKSQLDQISIVEEDNTVVNLGEKYGKTPQKH